MSVETDNTFGTTTIYCDGDNCKQEFTHESGDDHSDFTAAIRQAQKEGWVVIKTDDDWKHYHSAKCAGITPTPLPVKRKHSTFYGEEEQANGN